MLSFVAGMHFNLNQTETLPEERDTQERDHSTSRMLQK